MRTLDDSTARLSANIEGDGDGLVVVISATASYATIDYKRVRKQCHASGLKAGKAGKACKDSLLDR